MRAYTAHYPANQRTDEPADIRAGPTSGLVTLLAPRPDLLFSLYVLYPSSDLAHLSVLPFGRFYCPRRCIAAIKQPDSQRIKGPTDLRTYGGHCRITPNSFVRTEGFTGILILVFRDPVARRRLARCLIP